MKSKTGRKLLSFLLTLAMVVGLVPGMSLTAYAASTTVTWFASDITGENPKSFTKDGITITGTSIDYKSKDFYGPGTFTTESGKFTKIEVTARLVGIPAGNGWSMGTWTGDASSSVSYSGYILDKEYGKLRIVFTIETADASHSVTITPGSNMTKTETSGAASQTGLSGAMADVVYTANDGYYFPEDYAVTAVNGISVTPNSYTQITVSGTPTADAEITLTAPTAKTKPDAPTTAAAVDCTTTDNNDGKLTGVTTAMEYKKSDATDWSVGTGSDITGLVPGTYYVRLKATDTTTASDNQELTIAEYTIPSYQVIYKVVNGTWSDDSTTDKTETVQSGSTPASVPTGMKAASGYTGGAWDTNPAEATITGATTFTYTFTALPTYQVTYRVVNGTWSDDTTTDKTETVQSGSTPASVPTGMKAASGYTGGAWDTNPAEATITGATTFTYTYVAKEASVVTKAPEAKTLTYNGQAQALVTAGKATGGEMQYALGNETEATQPYKASIPTATDAGTYYVWYRVAGDDNHTDTQPAAIEVTISEVPVFSVQVTNDGNGTASANPASGETGTEVTLTAEPKEGYRFREWQVISGGVTVTDNRFRIGSANAEIRAVFEEIPVEPVQPVTYATVSAVGVMYTIGSGENAVITVERSTGDKRELELFTGAAVDGIPVPDGSYSAAKGSLILTLKSAYLDTLREGEHKVTISFRDGSAEAALTIKPAMKPAVTTLPKTGDGAKPVLWLGMIAAGLAVAFVAWFVKKRRER